MSWYDSYINSIVIDAVDAAVRANRLPDPRLTMYSCYDLGGAENGDDWMFQLSGGASKYSPIGLDFSHSIMMSTRRKGSALFDIKLNGERQGQWGCLACEYANADRVVMAGPYWGRDDVGFAVEFLRTDSGTCVVSTAFINRGENDLAVDIDVTLLDDLNQSSPLKDNDILDKDNYFAAFASRTSNTAVVQPGQTYEYICAISIATDEHKCRVRLADALNRNCDEFRERQKELANPESLKQFPVGKFQQLAHNVYNVMRQNILSDVDEVFSAPNRVMHKGQWLWDTCFHAIAWKLFDQPLAQQLLLNLFRYQEQETGFIPINADATFEISNYATQPPLIAMALHEVCDDPKVIAEVYPKLARFYEWFEENRMLSNGLFKWKSGGESGMDNSPRFDQDPTQPTNSESLNLCSRIITDDVAHVDFSCMIVNFASIMAEFAKQLGNDSDVQDWQGKADLLRSLINNNLYHEGDGFYYDKTLDGQWIKVKTVASFWALFAGVCDSQQANALCEHIMNPEEFFTEFPLPSVALNEPSFCMNYWRGAVWMNMVYMTVTGLRKYGFDQQSDIIISRVSDGIIREYYRTGHFWEIYNPLGGPSEAVHKKRQGPRQNANGFCGWTANLLNMIISINQELC